MAAGKAQPPITFTEGSGDRLDSWKEIAAYLKRDMRTVRRWEKEGLPVHRKVHRKQATVYAYRAEIDAWWNAGRQRFENDQPASRRKLLLWWVFGILAAGIAAFVALSVGRFFERTGSLAAAPPIRSLAVLPLENLSKDPEQEYFAEGMTEALTTELAQISALKVISHTSAARYRGTTKSLPQIAKELNVDAVVEGALQRSGDRVGITVQLIHAPSDRHVWAKAYERDVSDVLALQSEAAHAIAVEIKAKLTLPEKAHLAARRSVNAESYDDYLKGRFLLARQDGGDARKGIAYFQLAIQKDPQSALAYAGIAEAFITLSQPWNGAVSPKEALPQAKAAALNALAIDDSLGEAHSALAHVLELYDWDWQGAEREHRKAIELNANDAMGRLWYGEYLQVRGRYEESAVQLQQAIELDPLNVVAVSELGGLFFTARQYDEAERVFRKGFEMDPEYGWPHFGFGEIYAEKKMFRESIVELEKEVNSSNRTDEVSVAVLGKVLGDSGRKQEARKILKELAERSKDHYVSPYLVAYVQLGLGERDQAIVSLEQGYAERDLWMMYLKVDPLMDDLRADPRFHDLLGRLGLAQ